LVTFYEDDMTHFLLRLSKYSLKLTYEIVECHLPGHLDSAGVYHLATLVQAQQLHRKRVHLYCMYTVNFGYCLASAHAKRLNT
jgi:hypothetical protein